MRVKLIVVAALVIAAATSSLAIQNAIAKKSDQTNKLVEGK
jgi:hypothetical protein